MAIRGAVPDFSTVERHSVHPEVADSAQGYRRTDTKVPHDSPDPASQIVRRVSRDNTAFPDLTKSNK